MQQSEGISDELDQLDSKKAVSELYDSNNDNDSKIVLSIKEIEVGMESTTDSVNTEKISDESDNKKGAIFNAEKESDNILISMKKDLVDNDKKEEGGKTGRHGKEGERKWWILTQLPYSPQGNGRQSPRVEPGE